MGFTQLSMSFGHDEDNQDNLPDKGDVGENRTAVANEQAEMITVATGTTKDIIVVSSRLVPPPPEKIMSQLALVPEDDTITEEKLHQEESAIETEPVPLRTATNEPPEAKEPPIQEEEINPITIEIPPISIAHTATTPISSAATEPITEMEQSSDEQPIEPQASKTIENNIVASSAPAFNQPSQKKDTDRYILKDATVWEDDDGEDIYEIPVFTHSSDAPESKPLILVRVKEKKEGVKKEIIQKRGRKSIKELAADAEMIEIPDDEQLFQKHYYGIGEVAKMFGVNTSLIRFWETEFSIIKPRKNRKGDRLFRPIDIKNLLLIHNLLRIKKFTIEGAKDYLKNNKKKAEKQFEIEQSLNRIKTFLLQIKADLE